MFGKRSGKSRSPQDPTSTLYTFDNFQLYVEFLARQHKAHFKIASMTDMMKIVNGIEDDIPEVLYLEDRQFAGSNRSHNPDDPEHFELVDDDENELKMNFEQEEPFILIKKSKSLPTLVMPTKLINELKDHSLFKKAEKQVTPKSDSIDTDFEVLDDTQPPTSTD